MNTTEYNKKTMYKITEKRHINKSTVLMKVAAPRIAAKARAGQFVILRPTETAERIPLTVSGTDAATGEVTVIFQAVGATTSLLASLDAGGFVLDFAGPLGHPTSLPESGRAAVVGGGLGCAIAYPQAKELFARGVKTDIIAGFRNAEMVILEDELRACCDELTIMTDDGSYGKRGFVTDALREKLSEKSGRGTIYDIVIAIGPPAMMKFVSLLTAEYGIKTIVSLNPIMIDGTGMCGGCRVTVDGKIRFACVDGPDFDGHKVDFDELIKRGRSYAEEEAHACRMFGEVDGNA